jgi:hypothetical protein
MGKSPFLSPIISTLLDAIHRSKWEDSSTINKLFLRARIQSVSGVNSKKHQTTLPGCWFDLPGHMLYKVYDCPSRDAMQKIDYGTGDHRMVFFQYHGD